MKSWPFSASVLCWRSLFGFLLFLVLWLASLALFSTRLLADVPLRLATRPALPPYVYENPHRGIEIDLLKAIFKEAEIAIEFQQMPMLRMLQAYELGKVDALLTQQIDLKPLGCATDWYFAHLNMAITLAANDMELEKLADLKNFSVLSFVGARRFMGPAYAAAVAGSPNYVEAKFQEDHIELLYQRRFDVVVGDEWILRLGQKDLLASGGEFQEIRIHDIMEPLLQTVHFHDDDLCERFNVALEAVRMTGQYDAILQGYYQAIMPKKAP